MFRPFLIVLMMFVPGGLIVLAAFILAKTVAAQMAVDHGSSSERFKRAVQNVKWRDVWSSAREQLR